MKLGPVVAFAPLALLAVACSSGSSSSSGGGHGSFDALFSAPTNTHATAGDVHGLWGGSVTQDTFTFDFRFKFDASDIEVANRCKFPDGTMSPTVGATAAARVSDHDVTVLESKADSFQSGNDKCNVQITPVTYTYAVDGLSLTLTGPDGTILSMVKISD